LRRPAERRADKADGRVGSERAGKDVVRVGDLSVDPTIVFRIAGS